MEAAQMKKADHDEEVMVEGYAFVYGTLKVGGKFASRFDADRLEVVPCSINGTLYDTGWYPAIVLEGDGEVQGELHRYKNWHLVIERMDRIEGYQEERPERSLFMRRMTEMEIPNGGKVAVILYEFNTHNGVPKTFKVMESGLWEI